MRTTFVMIAAVAAVALGADPVAAQVARYGGYNPWTGRAHSTTVARNPFTGTVGARSTTVNPFTGRVTTSGGAYNPLTGAGARSSATVNPFTGRYGYSYGYRRY
jgi:hypothetical protein